MKGESAEELNRILTAVTAAVNAQESIGRPIQSHGLDLLNYLVVEMFDQRTRLEWETSSGGSSEPVNHDELVNFISARVLALNAAKPRSAAKASPEPRTAKTHHVKRESDARQCDLCKGKHSLWQCPELKAKSAADRKAFITSEKLCWNCLGRHVVAKCQSSRNCFSCGSRHHTLLHDASALDKSAEANSLTSASGGARCGSALLATARVLATDRDGQQHAVRVLVDQGSEVSIISEALVQRLRLPRARTSLSILGVGGSKSGTARGRVSLRLTAQTTGADIVVDAFVLPRLTLYRGPSDTHDNKTWPHIRALPLADPQFTAKDPVEILLGAEVCATIFEDGLRRGGPHTPLAQKTRLGWILTGGGEPAAAAEHRHSNQCTVDHDLSDLVQRFWLQESEPVGPVPLTPKEQLAESLFIHDHSRTAAGRYVVRLPFGTRPRTLADTRRPAERLLTAMDRKSRSDPRFGTLYRQFMQEYDDLQHMETVRDLAEQPTERCYLPHHGVLKEASTTTKLRVVFNGSQRSSAGESLNDRLLIGPNLLPSLADVLMRWRWHRYVFMTDVEKMYRQILVHPDDRDWQRILWRPHPDGGIQEYRLRTVTYGLACAPFLAIRTLRQLAEDEGARLPLGAAALNRDAYVDDIVTGADTADQANRVALELSQLCMAGGFPLRKWATNRDAVLNGIPREHRLDQSPRGWEGDHHCTLGLLWHPGDDTFAISLRRRTITAITKRSVLAETARLFDPLGWLTPSVIRAKILIQSAWLQGLDWDTPLPASDARLWRAFLEDLPSLERITVTRWLEGDAVDTDVELHGFADASERAYAAVLYLRVARPDSTRVHLLAARSKVAPVKPVSLPRLELSAAALLTNLAHHTRKVLNLLSAPVYLWSDSSVTLDWIHGHASRWKTFVANRVAHIQERLPEAQWMHVPGQENPADCASRGIPPSELAMHPLWWSGPHWLSRPPDARPTQRTRDADIRNIPESRTVAATTVHTIAEPELLHRFSSWTRLLRVTAWILRWRHPRRGPLEPDELRRASHVWVRTTQRLHYPAEVAAIERNRSVAANSPLLNLSAFLDEANLLRVGGRLKHASLSRNERHPWILPPASRLAELIVDAFHRRTLHGGVQLTLGLLRLQYWLPRGRAIIKRCLRRCTTCTRWRGAAVQPPMGPLPRDRVTPSRPFLRTGLDYAGPVLVRTSKGRGQRTSKAFIAVFVCFSTKAVHLELASDYTSEAFLAAFRRFTSRRGLPSDMFSDCGTNFVGADKELRRLFQASSRDSQGIAGDLASHGIKWHFNPPAAPHFGGLWEAAVKSAKFHLRRVIGEAKLTHEEFSTLLAQVEACLNSRPLRALSDDPDDLTALTPGHFLVGTPLLAIPEPSRLEDKETTLSRWHNVQRIRDHFWHRWAREYLHGVASSPKWHKPAITPHIGALCLIRTEATSPNRWPLARITHVHPGDDGIVRVVTVRTASSTLVRPVTKIVPLPGMDTDTCP